MDDDASAITRSEDSALAFARVVALTDGVFAIATTLLVLGITVDAATPDDKLTSVLLDQKASLVAYALSFAVLGRFWLSHHSFVGGLDRFDSTLMGANLVYLAWIALIPFTSELLGNFGNTTQAAIVYAAGLLGVTLTFACEIAYAYRRRLFDPGYQRYAREAVGPSTFAVAQSFVISMPVAFVTPLGASLLWIAAAIFVPARFGEPMARIAMGPRD
jgi:uncharacterized membrane protein